MYPNSYNPANYQPQGQDNKHFDQTQTQKLNSAEQAAQFGYQQQPQGQAPFAPSWNQQQYQHDWKFNSNSNPAVASHQNQNQNQNQYQPQHPNPQGFSSRSGEIDLPVQPAKAPRKSDEGMESSLVDMSALIDHIG
jgi:hypothetical protein